MGVTFQALQLLAAGAVLLAFVGAQLKRMTTDSFLYLALNAAGSGVLAIEAVMTAQWGFVLLEGAWAIVSAAGLVKNAAAKA